MAEKLDGYAAASGGQFVVVRTAQDLADLVARPRAGRGGGRGRPGHSRGALPARRRRQCRRALRHRLSYDGPGAFLRQRGGRLGTRRREDGTHRFRPRRHTALRSPRHDRRPRSHRRTAYARRRLGRGDAPPCSSRTPASRAPTPTSATSATNTPGASPLPAASSASVSGPASSAGAASRPSPRPLAYAHRPRRRRTRGPRLRLRRPRQPPPSTRPDWPPSPTPWLKAGLDETAIAAVMGENVRRLFATMLPQDAGV